MRGREIDTERERYNERELRAREGGRDTMRERYSERDTGGGRDTEREIQ